MRVLLVLSVLAVLLLLPSSVEAGDAVNIAVIVQGGETENLSISNSIGITAHGQGTDNLDITNAPDWYAFGMVHLSDVEETGLTHFTVTNVGDVDMDIAIYGTDMTGDVIPRIWTLSDNATPDYQTYGLLAGIPSGEGILGGLGGDEWATVGESGGDEWTELGEGGDYTIVIKKTPSYNILVYTLSPGESLEWGFEALFPTSGLGNEDMAGHVILGATKSTP